MYSGNNVDLVDLQEQITALQNRLTVIDGQGSDDPTEGALYQLSRKLEGLKTDLRQSVMKLEQILTAGRKVTEDLTQMVKQHLGLL